MSPHDSLPILSTPRLTLAVLGPEDAERCVRFNRENAEFLAPWEPPMLPARLDCTAMAAAREQAVADARAGKSYSFALIPGHGDPEAAITGWISITNVLRGVFQACNLGYRIDRRMQGHGYMSEAARECIRFVFETLRLHRIQAAYMPHNQRSAALLRGLGFTVEGTAKRYLFIGGEWRDHVLTSLTNPDPSPPPGLPAAPP